MVQRLFVLAPLRPQPAYTHMQALPSLPAPNSPAVSLSRREGGLVAAQVFGGYASEAAAGRQAEQLR